MAIDNHSFCWNGIASTEPEKVIGFYAKTLGWEKVDHTFPNGETATMFSAADFPRAHLMPTEAGMPSHWSSFLRVADVDAATERSSANGGGTLMAPTDIAPGRMSVVTSPSGAPLCLYHEADEEQAANAPAGPGSRHWTELHSADIDADLAWLQASFDFETETMPMPDDQVYYILKSEGQPRGGAMGRMTDEMPPSWLNWMEVADVDAAMETVKANEGKAFWEPADFPGVGRMVLVSDPTGGVFGLITPEAQAG